MYQIEKIADIHHYADGLRVNKAGKAVKNRGQYLEFCYRVAMGVNPMDAKADNIPAKNGGKEKIRFPVKTIKYFIGLMKTFYKEGLNPFFFSVCSLFI